MLAPVVGIIQHLRGEAKRARAEKLYHHATVSRCRRFECRKTARPVSIRHAGKGCRGRSKRLRTATDLKGETAPGYYGDKTRRGGRIPGESRNGWASPGTDAGRGHPGRAGRPAPGTKPVWGGRPWLGDSTRAPHPIPARVPQSIRRAGILHFAKCSPFVTIGSMVNGNRRLQENGHGS